MLIAAEQDAREKRTKAREYQQQLYREELEKKQRDDAAARTASAALNVEANKDGDYNPLMGGGSSVNYRPARKTANVKGGMCYSTCVFP